MKFTLGSENERNKTKEMNYYNVSLYLEPSMNFNNYFKSGLFQPIT